MGNLEHQGSRRRPGGRAVARPSEVIRCSECQNPLGRGYLDCPRCFEAIESIWLVDWHTQLAEESVLVGSQDELLLAQVICSEIDRHPWTIVDIAMTLVKCDECGNELGGGPLECPTCQWAGDSIWGYDVEAQHQGTMTGNEHALRVGRRVLRHPQRQKPNIVTAWKFSMPLLLTGQLPTAEIASVIKRAIDERPVDVMGNNYQSFSEAVGDIGKRS